MKTPNDYNVDTVYSYQSPKDLQRYYNDWAQEYDNYTKDVKYIFVDEAQDLSTDQYKMIMLLSKILQTR